MLYINGEAVHGLDTCKLTIFGTEAVSGTAEIALDNRQLDQERFYVDHAIPIIGEESFVRTTGFQVKTEPDMFDHLRMIEPSGLITFGVGTKTAAMGKVNSTHMDIVLREWGKGNGPHVPFLGVVVENVYGDARNKAIEDISSRIGSRAITMSRSKSNILIVT